MCEEGGIGQSYDRRIVLRLFGTKPIRARRSTFCGPNITLSNRIRPEDHVESNRREYEYVEGREYIRP